LEKMLNGRTAKGDSVASEERGWGWGLFKVNRARVKDSVVTASPSRRG
jgi:hypothetical protein